MLYKYHYVKEHKMHKLNQHFLFFIRKIRNVKKRAKYEPTTYFHYSFLNKTGKIAPHRKENKKLNDKFKIFFETFKKLDDSEKLKFYKLILFSKDLHLYFENSLINVSVMHKDRISEILGNDSFSHLMSELWDSLKTNSWEIDKHYEEIFNHLPESRICTFCGINPLSHPQSYRADYDHLAFKGDYPISAINLKNMAPSCSECNQKYKHDTDVFYKSDKTRRVFNYPFLNFINVQLDFLGTIFPSTDVSNLNGKWEIQIQPDTELTRSWDEVYKIRERYVRDILLTDYNTWIGQFKQELKDHGIKVMDENCLKKYFIMHFRRYGKDKLQKRYIVKSSLYKYLYKCNNSVLYNQLIKEIN